MDTPFEKLDAETRRDWREDPTSVALIETLSRLRTSVATQVLDAVKDAERDTESLAQYGGQLTALDNVLLIIRREK